MISHCTHAVIVTEDANYPSPQSESSPTRTTYGLRRPQRVFDNEGGIRGVASGKGKRIKGGTIMAALTYEQAQNVLQAALRKAEEIGVPSSIAVVDEGRELVAFARQTGALLASIEISIGKAYTACSMQMDTGTLAGMTAPGQPLAGLETSHRRPLVAFAGGQPLWIGDEIAGAVGVAGGLVEQDDQVATAAAAGLPQV
jgi:uncharacterized protein GlcG (DUF336 family)